MRPVVEEGRIVAVEVIAGGHDYGAQPRVVVDGPGRAATFAVQVAQGSVAAVDVIDGGSGHDGDATTLLLVDGPLAVLIGDAARPALVRGLPAALARWRGAPVRMLDRSIPGATWTRLARSPQGAKQPWIDDGVHWIDQVAALCPSMVIVALGVHDGQNFVAGMAREALERLTALPACDVLFITPLARHLPPGADDAARRDAEEQRDHVAGSLRALAASHGVGVLDLSAEQQRRQRGTDPLVLAWGDPRPVRSPRDAPVTDGAGGMALDAEWSLENLADLAERSPRGRLALNLGHDGVNLRHRLWVQPAGRQWQVQLVEIGGRPQPLVLAQAAVPMRRHVSAPPTLRVTAGPLRVVVDWDDLRLFDVACASGGGVYTGPPHWEVDSAADDTATLPLDIVGAERRAMPVAWSADAGPVSAEPAAVIAAVLGAAPAPVPPDDATPVAGASAESSTGPSTGRSAGPVVTPDLDDTERWSRLTRARDGLLDPAWVQGPAVALAHVAGLLDTLSSSGADLARWRCAVLAYGPLGGLLAMTLHLCGAADVLVWQRDPDSDREALAVRARALLWAVAAGRTVLTEQSVAARARVYARLSEFDLPALDDGDLAAALPRALVLAPAAAPVPARLQGRFDLAWVAGDVFDAVPQATAAALVRPGAWVASGGPASSAAGADPSVPERWAIRATTDREGVRTRLWSMPG